MNAMQRQTEVIPAYLSIYISLPSLLSLHRSDKTRDRLVRPDRQQEPQLDTGFREIFGVLESERASPNTSRYWKYTIFINISIHTQQILWQNFAWPPTWTIGMTKASVLPLPVGAEQQMSRGLSPQWNRSLVINSGIIFAWTDNKNINDLTTIQILSFKNEWQTRLQS